MNANNFEIKKDQIESDFLAFLNQNQQLMKKDIKILKFAKHTEDSMLPTAPTELK